MRAKRVGDQLVFHAGNGEWYNQQHDKRWDPGEDAADIPPARWHVELETVLAAQDTTPSVVVIDTTEMDWLVGQDLGFLVRIGKRLAPGRLKVVATTRVVRAVSGLSLDSSFELSSSLADALEDQGGD